MHALPISLRLQEECRKSVDGIPHINVIIKYINVRV